MIDERWVNVSKVPLDKLKTIGFGALKGKSDINPQWRIKAMTETYGLCGIGWYHELAKNWTETAPNGAVMAFCLVNVYIKDNGEWSKPICGMGGNEIVSIAKGELKQSDEGWKMAYTDALGTALKSIGVASEIYEGNFDGSKYQKENTPATADKKEQTPETKKQTTELKGIELLKKILSAQPFNVKNNDHINNFIEDKDITDRIADMLIKSNEIGTVWNDYLLARMRSAIIEKINNNCDWLEKYNSVVIETMDQAKAFFKTIPENLPDLPF